MGDGLKRAFMAAARTQLTSADQEQASLLDRIGATRNKPAFGVDFGELDYRSMGRLIRAGLAMKARAYRYGENRTRTGYWLTDAGRAALKP